MIPPPDADLTLRCMDIAIAHNVGWSTAYRWKKAAGIPMKRGRSKTREGSLCRFVSVEDWAEGCVHVGQLLGISRQAAWVMRNRLIAEGHELPKRKQGKNRLVRHDPQFEA